jgi:hypothetical protein
MTSGSAADDLAAGVVAGSMPQAVIWEITIKINPLMGN